MRLLRSKGIHQSSLLLSPWVSFKVLKRRERKKRKRADVGKYFLQKKKEKKNFSVEFPFLRSFSGDRECNPVLWKTLWHLYCITVKPLRTDTHRTIHHLKLNILAQILLKETQFRRYCFLANGYGESRCCSHVCLFSMTLIVPPVAG